MYYDTEYCRDVTQNIAEVSRRILQSISAGWGGKEDHLEHHQKATLLSLHQPAENRVTGGNLQLFTEMVAWEEDKQGLTKLCIQW